MDEQRNVADFVGAHDLETAPECRLLGLVSKLGELAKDANTATGYGESPADLETASGELGDALFALLAVAESLGINAGESLELRTWRCGLVGFHARAFRNRD